MCMLMRWLQLHRRGVNLNSLGNVGRKSSAGHRACTHASFLPLYGSRALGVFLSILTLACRGSEASVSVSLPEKG